MANFNTNSNSNINQIPKLKEDYSHYIFEWIPALQRDAATNQYNNHLEAVPPIQPEAPSAGMTDRQTLTRLQLIELWRKPVTIFLNFIKSGAEDTAFANIVQPHLLQRNPIAALAAIRQTLIRNSGLGTEREILTKFFDNYSKSGQFRDMNSLELDLVHATTLIETASLSLTAGIPLPPAHPVGNPHPNALTDAEKVIILRKLLIPLKRFEKVFMANQVRMDAYDHMVEDVRASITSINAYIAYSGNKESAADAKASHVDNEVDVATPALKDKKNDVTDRRGRSSTPNSHHGRRSHSKGSQNSQGSKNSNGSHYSNHSHYSNRSNKTYHHRPYTNRKWENYSNNKSYDDQRRDRYNDHKKYDNYKSRDSNEYFRSPNRSSNEYRNHNRNNNFQPKHHDNYRNNYRKGNMNYANTAPSGNIQYIPYPVPMQPNYAFSPMTPAQSTPFNTTNQTTPPVAFAAHSNPSQMIPFSPFQRK